MSRQGLAACQQLTARARQEVEALVAACKEHEPIDLPLLLDSVPPPEKGENLYFLYYHDGDLVGAASTWPGQEIEVIGAVHPRYRRRGIGRVLLDALRQEGRRRGVESLLLVCEEGSPAGVAFAVAMGAQHKSGEYRMELDRERYAQCPAPPRTLDLRKADAKDVDTLVALWTASSEVNPFVARERTLGWLSVANQRFFVGWLGERAVGMVRLHQGKSSVYVNSFRVYPELRGRGYGRQILVGVLDTLIAEDWPHIMIEVATDNTVALSLYRSCGYREIATYYYYCLDTEPKRV